MDRPPRVKTSVLDRQNLTLIKLGDYQRACGLYFVYSKVYVQQIKCYQSM